MNHLAAWKLHEADDLLFFPSQILQQQIRQSSKESTEGSSDTESSSDDESIQAPTTGPPEPSDKVQQAKETEAGAEISALVNYVQPVHFNSFENSESECNQITDLIRGNKDACCAREHPLEWNFPAQCNYESF